MDHGERPGACIANPADWLDGGVDEATQADFLTRSFNFLATDPYVEVATWYQFRDNFWLEGDPADREAHFGLLKVDFSEKPAYRAFKANATSTRPRTYAQTVRATDALAGWWRLNEAATAGTQAVDGRTIGLAGYPSSTPNPYTGGGIGVYTGGVAQGATSLLASDGLPSARLDGVDDFIRVPDRAPLDPGHAMTLEAWVKPSDLTGARHILAKADSYYLKATGPDLEFGWWTTGGTLRFAWAGEQLQVGRTNHVVATSDGRDSRVYVNGVQVASQPATGKVRATISPLYAGAYAQGATWAGQIDEPAVYTRALSADEIALHYRKGTFNTRIDSGPPATTTSTTASFTFSSQPGATYQCTLDTGAPTACTSPATYGNVPAGTHTLSVRATDTGGLSDSTPAKRTWTVAAP